MVLQLKSMVGPAIAFQWWDTGQCKHVLAAVLAPHYCDEIDLTGKSTDDRGRSQVIRPA